MTAEIAPPVSNVGLDGTSHPAAHKSSDARHYLHRSWEWASQWLPEGQLLHVTAWQSRHRVITKVALGQAIGLGVFALAVGRGVADAATAALIVGIPAIAGMITSLPRTTRMLSTVTSLMFASATLVGLCGGLTEAHFHFFVMLGVVSLYQDWAAFGLCVFITVVHHAAMGVTMPGSVFASGTQRENPVLWALVHGGFILAASVTHMVAWRFAEQIDRRDPLTQLPNRAEFADRSRHLLQAGDRPVAVLFVDLDDFKSINDSNGHQVGDVALNYVARVLRTFVADAGVTARVGGDEFAVLIDGDAAAGETVAARILSELQRPMIVDGRPIFVHASIGVADTVLMGSRLADDLLRGADLAMYVAKSAGRNRVVRYSAAVDELAKDRAELSHDLVSAVEQGQFEIHYQPVVALERRELCGVEALVRWNHPRRGLIAPSLFIPLAETTGVITELGAWVLRTAAHQAVAWQRELPGCSAMQLAVNLSPVQLRDPDLILGISETLSRSGLAAHHLIIEVTESMLLTDIELARRQLDALRTLGAQVSIDDFGTGYSSLSYLARLPTDQVKIDRSFVQDLDSSSSSSVALVRAIVEMARALGLDIQAEGVETRNQQQILDDLGCPRAQGYLYSRPLPAPQFASFVTDGGTAQDPVPHVRLAAS